MIQLVMDYLGLSELTAGSPQEFFVIITSCLLLVALVSTVVNVLTSVFNNIFR